MQIDNLLTKFLFIFCLGLIFSAGIKSETVEVPQNAENYYSEEHLDDPLEPEITIIKKKGSVHEEYRLNGKLYMVKVIPSLGPPFYYVDQNGDGVWDTKTAARDSSLRVPQWVIFSW